jgi:hypothetical protein
MPSTEAAAAAAAAAAGVAAASSAAAPAPCSSCSIGQLGAPVSNIRVGSRDSWCWRPHTPPGAAAGTALPRAARSVAEAALQGESSPSQLLTEARFRLEANALLMESVIDSRGCPWVESLAVLRGVLPAVPKCVPGRRGLPWLAMPAVLKLLLLLLPRLLYRGEPPAGAGTEGGGGGGGGGAGACCMHWMPATPGQLLVPPLLLLL